MTWVPLLAVTLSDEWVVASLGIAFSALTLAIRTLYRDLTRKGERTAEVLTQLTSALEAMTSETQYRLDQIHAALDAMRSRSGQGP